MGGPLLQPIGNRGGYVPPDHGIDPFDDFLSQDREDEERAIPWAISCISNTFCLLFCPVYAFCMCQKVKLMHDSVVYRCGIPQYIMRKNQPYCINPACTEIVDVDLRMRGITIKSMPSNDSTGSPILVSAQLDYRITNSLVSQSALIDIRDFVHAQAMSALNSVCTKYPYDDDSSDTVCLHRNVDRIAEKMKSELQALVLNAGIHIQFFRLESIGFNKDMAPALLARQEAHAKVIARALIVEGVMGLIQEKLQRLNGLSITMTPAEHAAFVQNLTYLMVHQDKVNLTLVHGVPVPQMPPLAQVQPQKEKERDLIKLEENKT